ncbi:MAG: ABC transporter substrate-binding protein [Eubacteriales bacterium]
MKNRSRKLVALLVGMSMTISLLAGCGASTEEVTEEVATEVTEEVATEVAEEVTEEVVEETGITFTDLAGNEITLDEPATKLVGTHNPTLNIAVIIGGGGKYIAGFGNKEMASGLYSYVFPELDDVVQIGTGSEINYEECIAQGADFAILPERFAAQVDQFAEVGITAAVVLPNTESYETIVYSLETMGTILGEDERAAEIISFFEGKIEEAKAVAETIEESPRALYLGGSTALSVANGIMLQSVMLETVGAENVAKDVEGEGDFVEVSVEEIIGWNPEVIYVPVFASYTVEDVLSDPAWSEIDAVKEGRVYQFPSALEPWDYPTPSAAMGLTWLIQNLYPELYTLEEVVEDANEYYDLVYGQTFTAEEMGLE